MNGNEWQATPAVRKDVPLLIGLEGPPGTGKTVSALLLAQGMQDIYGHDRPIIVIDTEHRATKYAGMKVGAAARPFAFEVVRFDPPFRANRYHAAVLAQIPRRPSCIIIDTMSDEHEGQGGRIDWHKEELDNIMVRLGRKKDEWGARNANSQSGWIPSSEARKRMIAAFSRIETCPIIMTFRAQEKMEQRKESKDGRERVVPTNIGFRPIAPAQIVYAVDIMALLPPRADGVPRWRGGKGTEEFTIKLPEQFRGLFKEGEPISPAIGAALARWAKGETLPETRKEDKISLRPQPERLPPGKTILDTARELAAESADAFNDWWYTLTDKQQDTVLGIEDELMAIAAKRDAPAGAAPEAPKPPDDDAFPGDTPSRLL